MNGKIQVNYPATFLISFSYSLGYQAFMLSLKSQISILDNFVIREESISPVLAMMGKENSEHLISNGDGTSKDVSLKFRGENFMFILRFLSRSQRLMEYKSPTRR